MTDYIFPIPPLVALMYAPRPVELDPSFFATPAVDIDKVLSLSGADVPKPKLPLAFAPGPVNGSADRG